MNSAVFIVAPGTRNDASPAVSTFMQGQIDSLGRLGCDVQVGVLDARTSLAGAIRNFLRLRTELSRSEAATVHALYGSVTAGMSAAIKGRRRLVISFCGDDLLGTPIPGWHWRAREFAARWLGLTAGLFADRIVVKSRNLRAAVPGFLRARVVVLPNGVDADRFRPRPREVARTQLGWPLSGKVVLFHASRGGNERVKNPELARAAVERASCARPSVELRSFASLTPDEVALTMNAADCLLVTSLHEGSPNVVKEAMACNLPVVAVDCGDVGERLAGVIPSAICPYDADAIARALVAVLDSGLRSNGREQILTQGLALPAVARRLAGIYAACGESVAAATGVRAAF